MTKMCARISNAKFIAKTDGHCAFDEGFDVKLIEGFKKTGDNVVCALRCATYGSLIGNVTNADGKISRPDTIGLSRVRM